MKKNRLAEITIILGIILIILVSFIGIYVQNQSIMENKINEFSYGEELSGYIEIVFETESEISEEKMKSSKKIMEQRLKDIELEEYELYQNPENGNILLRVSDDENIDYIAHCLYQQGKFEIIDSDTKEVLMNSNDVKDSYAFYENVTTGTAIYMAIEFNEEGTEKLKQISEKYMISEQTESEETTEDTESEENLQISLVLDGNTMITTGFSDVITNGMIYVTVGSATTDKDTLITYVEEATKLATAIKNGEMPLSYSISSNTYIASNITESDLINVVYGIGIIVIIALIVLVAKYKKIGLLTSLAYLGCIAVYLLLIRYTDSTITFNSICGIILTLILDYILTAKIAMNIKSDDSIKEVKEKFKKVIIDFIILLVPVIILAIVTAFINGAGINSLGIVLFWGIFTMLIYNFIVTKNLLEVRTRK